MTDDQQQIDRSSPLQQPGEPRNERREFFRAAIGATALTVAGASALAIATSASAATIADNDIVNFLLQLEYFAAQYYSFAVTGAGLPAAQLTGTGTAGAATGARQVSFTDPILTAYAKEFAQDLAAHVAFLRVTLDSGVVAQPAIDLGTDPTGAFSRFAAAAKIVATGASFDPYVSEGNFLLGAFMFEDAIVSAYQNISVSITDKTLLASIMGLLSSHAHHAAAIRSLLYARGVATPTLRTNADAISGVRDALDGTGSLDKGISPITVNGNLVSQIAPASPDGVGFSRTFSSTLNILYLTSASATKGGFFPAGLNGAANTSTAN